MQIFRPASNVWIRSLHLSMLFSLRGFTLDRASLGLTYRDKQFGSYGLVRPHTLFCKPHLGLFSFFYLCNIVGSSHEYYFGSCHLISEDRSLLFFFFLSFIGHMLELACPPLLSNFNTVRNTGYILGMEIK